MEKVKFPVVMLVVVGIMAAFLCGLFIGRSGNRDVLYEELPESQPATQSRTLPEEPAVATTETTEDAETTEATIGIVNINKASVEELTALPGIGEVLAQRIVDYRLENGPFQTTEELMNVSGVGEKKYEAVEPYIIVR